MSYCPLHRIFNCSAEAILAFCVMNNTFPQSYYILQLLTMGSDCPVPVDNYNSVKFLSQPHKKSKFSAESGHFADQTKGNEV